MSMGKKENEQAQKYIILIKYVYKFAPFEGCMYFEIFFTYEGVHPPPAPPFENTIMNQSNGQQQIQN